MKKINGANGAIAIVAIAGIIFGVAGVTTGAFILLGGAIILKVINDAD
ncbi:MAG: hypothetical protein WC520_03370 [Candidatus Paceibacterota bacterium]